MKDISIIITNYNYGRYIESCVRSCLLQKEVNHEVIIVDDCSTDNSIKVISDLCSLYPQIKFIRTPSNLGVAGAANAGLNIATGRFFIRVDADDYIHELTCAILRECLVGNHNALGAACEYYLVNSRYTKKEKVSWYSYPISCGVMYRTEILRQYGFYNASMRHKEERELQKRLGLDYKIISVPIPLYRYRMHENNKTLSKEYKETKV